MKKLFTLLLTLPLAVIFCTVWAAVSVVAEGVCGSHGRNVEWKLYDNGKLIISGFDAMADFGMDSAPWFNYRGKITSVEIQNGITNIGNYSFWSCSKIESIEIPNTVTSIGTYVFMGTSSLTSVTLPDGLESIGEYAFYGSSNLARVNILSADPPELKGNAFPDYSTSLVICVPYSKVDVYKGSTSWSSYVDEIQGLTATVTVAPTAIENLVYDGERHNIITAGEAVNGTIVYSEDLDQEFKSEIPTHRLSDSYTVYYKAIGDGTIYGDSEVAKIEASIARAVNYWTEELSIQGWTYGDAPNEPTAAAAFGSLYIAYCDTEDGVFLIDVPKTAGTWFIIAEVPETQNYTGLRSDVLSFEIAKATPSYTIPTGLKATEGQTLADVTLPDGWTWKDALETSVGTVGENDFKAVFTPADTNNYEVAEESVKITVAAKPTAIAETAAVSIYAADGAIYCDAETYTIYNAAGQDVTAENGSLKGLYVVVVDGNAVKIKVN